MQEPSIPAWILGEGLESKTGGGVAPLLEQRRGHETLSLHQDVLAQRARPSPDEGS